MHATPAAAASAAPPPPSSIPHPPAHALALHPSRFLLSAFCFPLFPSPSTTVAVRSTASSKPAADTPPLLKRNAPPASSTPAALPTRRTPPPHSPARAEDRLLAVGCRCSMYASRPK